MGYGGFFFFSSRRRHTRCGRDWSSDVCSSDLLWYAALASEKSYCSLHLMRAYGDPQQTAMLQQAFARAGKKLDMGKACLRFKIVEDLELDSIGAVIAGTPPAAYIEIYQKSRKR